MPNDPNTTGSSEPQDADLQGAGAESTASDASAEAYEPLETGEGVIRESWEESTAQFSEPRGDGSYTARFYFGRSNAPFLTTNPGGALSRPSRP